MRNFKNWFNAFLLVLLFTTIIDLIVNAQGHLANGNIMVMIIVALSILWSALIIRNLFILNKKKNKR